MDDNAQNTDVNVQELMQQIRRQILAKRAAQNEDETAALVPVAGRRLPPEFYDHLYQAGLAYNEISVPMHVTETSIPVIGSLIDAVRARLHELVLFYINQVAVKQTEVNMHLLRALSILSETLEDEAAEVPAGDDA
jgi:hypothetical protein